MPNLPEGHMNTLETGPLLEIQSGELRRELLLSRIIGNAFAVLLIGTATMAWLTGSRWWFAGYLAGSAGLAVIINFLANYTRERQQQRGMRWAEALHELAVRDELTGLYNRRLFNVAVEQWIGRAEAGTTGLSLALVDVDGLKRINDTLGHAAGDVAIRTIAAALTEAVPKGACVTRHGGDEFAILWDGAAVDGQVLRRQIDVSVRGAPLVLGAQSERLSVSSGFATWRPGMESDGLLREADADLYTHKAERWERLAAA